MIDSIFLQSTSNSQLVKDSNEVQLGQLIKTMAHHFCKEITCTRALLYMYKFYLLKGNGTGNRFFYYTRKGLHL